MTPRRYRLLKDLPDAKLGDIYVKEGNWGSYLNEYTRTQKSPVIESNSYFSWQVENNPDWFEEIKEEPQPIKIEAIRKYQPGERIDGDCVYVFQASDKLPRMAIDELLVAMNAAFAPVQHKNPEYSERPPLGVMPEWRWHEIRHYEISEAIDRYMGAGISVPQKWIEEKYQLSKKTKRTLKKPNQ